MCLLFLDDFLEGVRLFNLGVDLFLFKLLQAVLDVFDRSLRLLIELTSTFAIYVEAENLWFVKVDLRRQDYGIGVVFEENLREGATEIGTVDVDLSELRKVDLLTAWAEDLETGGFQSVR